MNPHQFPLTPLAKVLLAVLLGVAAPMTQAITLNAGTQYFDLTRSNSVIEYAGVNNQTVSAGTSLSFQRFDPLTGKLNSVHLGLASTLSVDSLTRSTAGGGSQQAVVTSQGSSSAQGTLNNVPGLPNGGTSIGTSNVAIGSSCTDIVSFACNGALQTTQGERNLTLSTGDAIYGGIFQNVAAYSGAGQFTLFPVLEVNVKQTNAVFTGLESTAGTGRWQGSVSLSYDYDLHALASFGNTADVITALTLDFGTLYKDDTALGQAFQISNWSGSSERVGLQLDGVSATGDFARFDSGLSGFSDLSGGTQYGSQAGFNTSELGNFVADYVLRFSDAGDPSLDAYSAQTLSLTLKGNVIDRPSGNTVPEPSALALLSLGLAGLALSRRKA